LGLALAVADEVYIMESGQIVYNGHPKELAANEHIKHEYLGV
jgi:ABC-type branched-subunit amino acid transport system ATPase component